MVMRVNTKRAEDELRKPFQIEAVTEQALRCKVCRAPLLLGDILCALDGTVSGCSICLFRLAREGTQA